MSENEPQEIIGIVAIAQVLGVGTKTLKLWIVEAAATDDPVPVYPYSPASNTRLYAYADELRAWKRRRPVWRPQQTAHLDSARQASTITTIRQPKE